MKLINRIAGILGYKILSSDNYNNLIGDKKINRRDTKTEMLNHFFEVLKTQNIYPEVIYDVGANTGSWTKKCLEFFPDSKYFLFEPQVDFKPKIEKKISGSNYKLFQVGCGNKRDIIPFTLHHRNDSCSFSFAPKEAEARNFTQVDLPITTLDILVKEEKIPFPSLLKVDAEGLDIEVLEGSEELLPNIEIILIEVGVMNKRIRNSVLETMNFLDKRGFILFDITELNRPFQNEVLWLAELVFVKKEGKLDKNYNL